MLQRTLSYPWTLRNNRFSSTSLVMASNISHPTHSDGIEDMSRRAQKRKNAHKHYVNKHKVDKEFKQDSPRNETEYYFENGLRKVYPYYFNFNCYVKGRWIGRTLVDVYMKEMRGISVEVLEDKIRRGQITVNGKKVALDFKLKDGHFVENCVHRHENPVNGGHIEIIANTPELVVINKPPSIPCHPCGRYRYNTIPFILGMEYGLKNLRTLYRLDRLTSGVLVLPKTTKGSQKWEKQLMNKEFYKEYVCRVEGEFPQDTITCNERIEIFSHKVALFKVGPKGKPSTTTFTRLSFNGTSSVVKCVPLTGRSHQIRIHLQYLGYPIINDPIYNRDIYGKSKGKGGVIERPESEIVEDIMSGTNTGRRKIGKNPKFAEFLAKKDATAEEKDSSITTDEVTSIDCGLVDKDDSDVILEVGDKIKLTASDDIVAKDKEYVHVSETSACTMEEQRERNIDDLNGESEAVIKMTSDIVPESDEKCDNIISDRLSNQDLIEDVCANYGSDSNKGAICDVITDHNDDSNKTDDLPCKRIKLDTECDDASINLISQAKDSANTDIKPETFSDTNKAPNEGTKTLSDTNKASNEGTKEDVMNTESLTPVVPAKFDESKITYDVNCEECEFLFQDPTPSDLVLYLHAVRYKGPDWEFSTPLPEWAEPDWIGE